MCSEVWKEIQLKLLHRAYISFFTMGNQLVARKPQSSFPECGLSRPSLKHFLWDCPNIVKIWESITRYIKVITGTQIQWEPILYIFSINSEHTSPWKQRTKTSSIPSWIHICLLTARRAIMQTCSRPTPPTMEDITTDLQSYLSWKTWEHNFLRMSILKHLIGDGNNT